MDKTLDTVVLVHRLIIVLALALFAVGISAHRPNSAYDEAEEEIERLQKGIAAVSDQVQKAYRAIYDGSELKAATLAWLKQRNAPEQNIDVRVVSPDNFAIPDSTQDSLVTLEAQVKWAGGVYRNLHSPFFLCSVKRGEIFQALDKLFGASELPRFTEISVYVREAQANSGVGNQLRCDIELQYEVQIGPLTALRTAMLDVPREVLAVTEVGPPGANSVDLEIVGTLKASGLGDYEDEPGMAIFRLREFWTDLGSRSPDAALAMLNQRKEGEAGKAREKIEILGTSLSGSVTIMLGTVVELCLMIYLLAHLKQVHAFLPGHEAAISEAPFFGIMKSRLGQLVILATVFIIPFVVCAFVLFIAFPTFKAGSLSWRWVAETIFQWTLIAAIGVSGWLLFRQACDTKAVLGRADGNAATAVTGTEKLG